MFVSKEAMDLGETVAAALLGVDGLYRKRLAAWDLGGEDPLAGEGLVAVNLSSIPSASYEDWAAAAGGWEMIRQRAGGLADPSRRAYYEDLAISILSIIAWARQGDPHPEGEAFERLGERMLGLERLRFTDEEWKRANDALKRHLVEAGHSGSTLEESLRSWETSTRVPEDEVLTVLGDLLAISRSWVEARMFPLSPDRVMRPVGVRDVSYSAYCDFAGGEMQVNLDQPYTIGS